jgi:hypothetical protein
VATLQDPDEQPTPGLVGQGSPDPPEGIEVDVHLHGRHADDGTAAAELLSAGPSP